MTDKPADIKKLQAENDALRRQVAELQSRVEVDAEEKAALKLAEEKYRTIFANSGTAVCVIEEDHTISLVNESFEELSGYKAEEVEHKIKWPEFVVPEDLAYMQEQHKLRREQPGKAPTEYEFRFVDRHKQIRHIHLFIDVISGTSQSIASLLDITGRKQTEIKQQIFHDIASATMHVDDLNELSRQVLQSLESYIDTTNFFIALYDKASNTLSLPFEKDEKDEIPSWQAEGSATGLLIKKKKSLLLRKADIEELISREEIQQVGNMCEAWLGVPLISDREVIGAIVIQDYENPDAYSDDTREILEFVANHICLAIQRQKTIEELRFQSLILDQIRDRVTVTDLEGKITYVNQAECEMMGLSAEQLIGRYVKEYGDDPEEGGTQDEVLREALEKGHWQGEMVNIIRDGRKIHLDVRISSLQDENGNRIGLCGVSTDITERKKTAQKLLEAKEKAEESSRLKSAFLANVSHEIRTPMNAIIGFLELLKEPDLEGDQRLEFIDIVNQSGQRLLQTINDIIEAAKLEAGQAELALEEVVVPDTLHYLQKLFSQQAREQGLEFRLKSELPPGMGAIITDRLKLEGILTNLLGNALKFTREGSIELGCYLQDQMMTFYVKDTGVGIPEDKQQAIFGRFVQADLELSRGYEGSGLGLSIVKAYADLLGGQVSLESVPGQGSTFTVAIPFESARKEMPITTTDGEEELAAADVQSILVAEDDIMSYQFLEVVLKKEGLKPFHVMDGQAAVDAVRNNSGISLVLMDWKMPIKDGLIATREIRTFNPDIPIIIQTAHALEGDKAKAHQAGANDYVSKPVSPRELRRLIREHMPK